MGGLHGGADEGLPAGCGTLLLLGPARDFWEVFSASPEAGDGAPDPIDRWSERVISGLARRFGGQALFPFGGPPHRPFLSWALATGRAWVSPVGMLVHDETGLMVSFRGALALPGRLALPAPGRMPCEGCARPCLDACPVGALGAEGYDTAACHGFLDTPAGADCMSAGCRVRRACPASAGAGRLAAQSAHHMAHFHKPGQR